MVIGNFSLLTELNPEEVQAWYLLVYADAYEWVELPNVAGNASEVWKLMQKGHAPIVFLRRPLTSSSLVFAAKHFGKLA